MGRHPEPLGRLPGAYHAGLALAASGEEREALLRRWAEAADAAGAFPEWFPGERSFCATAYSAGYALEALERGADPSGEVVRTAERAVRWLGRQPPPEDANQVSAALVAAALLWRRTGQGGVGRCAARFAAALGSLRMPEGWFRERGGFDAGYGTLTLSNLVRAARATDWPTLHRWARDAEASLLRLLPWADPSPWEVWSRETAFLLPGASPAWNAALGRTSHGEWDGWDARYAAFFAAPQRAIAGRAGAAPPRECGRWTGVVAGTWWFEDPGRWVVGLAKGGTVRWIPPGGDGALLDLGYVLLDRRGGAWTTRNALACWRGGPERGFEIWVPAVRAATRFPPPAWCVVLGALISRGAAADPVSRLARRWAARTPRAAVWLRRRIRAVAGGLRVEDRFVGLRGRRISLHLNRGEAGPTSPVARRGPGVGTETWVREALSEGDRERLMRGLPLRWGIAYTNRRAASQAA